MARSSPLTCENEYLMLALGEKTADQALVGSIVWAFRRLKPTCREMSARGYALHSVRPQLCFHVVGWRTGRTCIQRHHKIIFPSPYIVLYVLQIVVAKFVRIRTVEGRFFSGNLVQVCGEYSVFILIIYTV